MYSLVLHGRSSVTELQKWRHLSVLVKLLQNESAFSNSLSSASAENVSPRDSRKGKVFSVSYLVGSLGFSTKLAESVSRKVSLAEKGNLDSVLSLLRGHGFTDSQISNIIAGYPGLLKEGAEKSIGPKLKFLQSRGAPTSELTEIVSKVPKILGKKEGKTSSTFYDFIKEIIEADKSSKFQKLSHSLPKGSQQENIIRNVLALRELGMPQKLLFSMLISDFNTVCGKEKFEESLKKVVELGFDPTSPKFVQALNFVYQMSDKTIQEKVNVYKRLGLGERDVWEIFKKFPALLGYPEKKITDKFDTLNKCGLLEDEVLSLFKKFPQCLTVSEQNMLNSVDTFVGLFSRDEFVMMVNRFPACLNYSAETVKKKTEFLVKKMNWPLNALLLHPAVFGYSMEKRIVPRCNVIKALISKGLLGSELPPISSVFGCNDEAFVKRYVRKNDDHELMLMAIFTGKKK